MITLSDQILVSLCAPLDIKLSNIVIDGSNIIIETKSEYLTRIDIGNRYLGMEVNFLSPSGIYSLNNFINLLTAGGIINTKYIFNVNTSDNGFVIYENGGGGGGEGGHIIRDSDEAFIQRANLLFGNGLIVEDDDANNSTNVSILIDDELDLNSTNPVQNSVITEEINLLKSLFLEHPVYISPTASITNITQTVENGSNINGTLTITYVQNDGGSAILYTVYRNGISVSNLGTYIYSETNIQSSIIYSGSVSYNAGPIKNNNLGEPDSVGQISSGTTTSSVRTITPQLLNFWGNSNTIPISSAEVRSLSDNIFSTNTTFTLITGTTNNNFIVAIPATKSIISVIDITNLNTNLTSNYILINGNFNVNDIGGNSHSYKLYAMTTAIPYTISANHVITTN